MIKEKYEAIRNEVENFDSNDMIGVWNEYCESRNDYDSIIEYMDSFDDLMCGKTPTEIADMVSGSDFRTGDDYFAFNAYGNIKSFSYWDDSDSPVYIDEDFIEFIEENYHDIDNYCGNLWDNEDIKEAFVQYVNFEDTDFDYDKIGEIIEEYISFDNIIEDDWDEVKDAIHQYILDNQS